jgi:hypothetical protein
LGKYANETTVLKLAASKAAKAILGDTASGDMERKDVHKILDVGFLRSFQQYHQVIGLSNENTPLALLSATRVTRECMGSWCRICWRCTSYIGLVYVSDK